MSDHIHVLVTLAYVYLKLNTIIVVVYLLVEVVEDSYRFTCLSKQNHIATGGYHLAQRRTWVTVVKLLIPVYNIHFMIKSMRSI